MEFWLLVVFLGFFTYDLLKRSVERVTTTPVWILWLVIMAPPIIWSAWILVYGQRPPLELLFIPFLISPFLYWVLVQTGRQKAFRAQERAVDPQNQNSDVAMTNNGTSEQPKLTPINKTEETNLRNCFPWSIYYLEKLEYRPQAVLCFGKLRANPEVAYQTIHENIKAEFGDRFLVIFQESLSGKPFFALVPNPRAKSASPQQNEPLTQPILALALLIISLFTATVGGTQMSGIANTAWQNNPTLLLVGLPYALALISILGLYELSQYLIARFYRVRITLPYFIPIPPVPFWDWNLGTFGAFIQRREPVPNRKALFDIIIAGPIVGLILTLVVLFWGLTNSTVVPLSQQSGILNFDSLNPRFSLLLSLISKGALGNKLNPQTAIDLHPLAIAGYIGFIWTAFKLIPVGQLDGGHIVHAIFGQRTSIVIGQITWVLMLLRALIQPDLFIWAIILLFIPLTDEPALNDVSQLDNGRDFVGLLVLAVLVSIILPVPESITQLLRF